MREEFEIKILIYWLYKLCTPAYSQGSFRAGGFQCVSYWFCLNHFIVITQKGLWYFVCEVVNENWWRNFHWFYIFGVYIVYSFIRYQIFSPQREERLRFSSIVWENSLFTNIYDQDWVAVSNAWDPNEVLCVGKQWIYRNLHALNMYLCWNILLSDIASE